MGDEGAVTLILALQRNKSLQAPCPRILESPHLALLCLVPSCTPVKVVASLFAPRTRSEFFGNWRRDACRVAQAQQITPGATPVHSSRRYIRPSSGILSSLSSGARAFE